MNKKNSFLAATTVFCFVMGGVMLLKSNKKGESDNISLNESLVGNVHNQAVNYREKILQKTIPSKVTKTKAYKNFVDSRITTDNFLQESRLGQAKEVIRESFKSLKECYKDGCGQIADEDDGFYDPALTVAQQSLRRVLEITAKNPKEMGIKDWITEEDLIDLLGAENKHLRKAAFANLVHLKGQREAFSSILEQARDLEGDAAAETIKNLTELVSDENKQDLIDIISLINKESDSATIIGILENLTEFKVTLSQINQISEGLCRFKENKTENHNIKAMNYYIKSMAKNSGINLDTTNYCL